MLSRAMEYGTGHLCVLQLQVVTRATTDEFEEGCAVTYNKTQTRLPKQVCFADWHGGAQLDAPERLCLAQLFQPLFQPSEFQVLHVQMQHVETRADRPRQLQFSHERLRTVP